MKNKMKLGDVDYLDAATGCFYAALFGTITWLIIFGFVITITKIFGL